MSSASTLGQIWGTRARDWAETQEGKAAPLYNAVLEETAVGANTKLLDVGCGAGMFCEMAAKRGAQVSGLDASEPLLAIARERVRDGDFRIGDLQELPYAAQTFDVVTGFNSFQFAANPVKALQEANRVSRTGTVVMAVFGKPEENDSTAYMKALGPLLPPPPPGAPGPFALSVDGALEALVIKAGMTPGKVKTVECPWDYPDEKTALRALLSAGPAIRATQNKGEDVVRQVFLNAIAPFKTASGGYHLKSSFRYIIATT